MNARDVVHAAWRIAMASGPAFVVGATLLAPGIAGADGESAVDAGSGRQQSLLEHRRQQLDRLRERITALDETASRAVARAAALEGELDESRRRLETLVADERALEAERDTERERADALAAALATRDGELAEQRERLDAAALAGADDERAREDTLAVLERHGLDAGSLDEALEARRVSREALQTRLDASDGRAADLERALAAERERGGEREGERADADARIAALAARLEDALADVARLDGERARAQAEHDATRRAGAANASRVAELEQALAGARARLEQRADDEAGPSGGTLVTAPVEAATSAPATTLASVGGGAAVAEPLAGDLVLSERWYVPLENGAPRDYIGHDALDGVAELPPASACETFAGGAAADGAALAKLEINGFPVTAFWVRREDGRPGICRLVPRTSGAFDARLSSLAVLRSERAIVVTRRGGRR